MALDEAAVDRALVSITAKNPLGAPAMRDFVRDIFAALTEHAVIDPAGDTPMTVNVSGTPTAVTGTGRIT